MNTGAILSGMGINVIVGQPVIGVFSALYSTNIGGYKDPNFIDGYRYNPSDSKWYLAPPAPFFGQYEWNSPADLDTQQQLTVLRYVYERHNKIENLGQGDGDRNRSFPMEIVDSISSLFNSTHAYTPANVPTTVWATPQRYDPLTLDLDGDGNETHGIDPAQPIYFDHTGAGVAQASGWIAADDGFLVLDRNGNGLIDNGTELFGDSTPLADGGKAFNGFHALFQEDTNQDGWVDADDQRYADLKVWRDLNQNGSSEADELKTLAESGIQALKVDATPNYRVLDNGNVIADVGSFIRSDGSTADMATTQQLGDVDLVSDAFLSRFTDTIPLTEQALALPGMRGSGQVRDMREAASLSGDFAAVLTQYAAGASKTDQLTMLDTHLPINDPHWEKAA